MNVYSKFLNESIEFNDSFDRITIFEYNDFKKYVYNKFQNSLSHFDDKEYYNSYFKTAILRNIAAEAENISIYEIYDAKDLDNNMKIIDSNGNVTIVKANRFDIAQFIVNQASTLTELLDVAKNGLEIYGRPNYAYEV
ncbi:hypothetical protein D302_gp092 [Campylobacter phage CP30A]|uniref:Uncharacterized protein n=1 Tax=Campylobacter phage CP30A TaxID=1229752 RepID=J9SV88_9CAUD|nr:hypothetical protein D302_gp092 [Campylobacter phage CP30A]AFR52404.1 hypothetical protein [Campylobacter phage CP30A]